MTNVEPSSLTCNLEQLRNDKFVGTSLLNGHHRVGDNDSDSETKSDSENFNGGDDRMAVN